MLSKGYTDHNYLVERSIYWVIDKKSRWLYCQNFANACLHSWSLGPLWFLQGCHRQLGSLLRDTWKRSKDKLKFSLALPVRRLPVCCLQKDRRLSHLCTVNSIGDLVCSLRNKMIKLSNNEYKGSVMWLVRGENTGISLSKQTGSWSRTCKLIVFESLLC